MNNIGNCWLSPDGEVIYCDHHDCKAWDIIERRFGIHPADVKDPSQFLGAMIVPGGLAGGFIIILKDRRKLKLIKFMSLLATFMMTVNMNS